MRLLTALLLSMVSLFADTSDRLPNTRKVVPVRAAKRAAPGSTGRAGTPTMKMPPSAAHKATKGNSKPPARPKNGAIARAVSGSATPATASKTRRTATHTPRPQ
jgi:hypothetical protein